MREAVHLVAGDGVDRSHGSHVRSADVERRCRTREGSFAVALGPLVAALAAGLLSASRDDVGVTNVALVLAMIVVAAALAGRMAGIVTALTAAPRSTSSTPSPITRCASPELVTS